ENSRRGGGMQASSPPWWIYPRRSDAPPHHPHNRRIPHFPYAPTFAAISLMAASVPIAPFAPNAPITSVVPFVPKFGKFGHAPAGRAFACPRSHLPGHAARPARRSDGAVAASAARCSRDRRRALQLPLRFSLLVPSEAARAAVGCHRPSRVASGRR